MRYTIAVAVALMHIVLNTVCFASDNVIGSWSDKNNVNIYDFHSKGDFEYYKKIANHGDNLSLTEEGKLSSYKSLKGVFSKGKDICRMNIQKGDLMIYAEEMQCCIMTQIIAEKLVLTEVFSKGNDDMNMCTDRVLNRINTLPKSKE
jgi:hypothetical protein